MNRVVVADLPGMPEKLRGKTGYQLLSAEALAALIKPHRESLGIPTDVPDSDLPRQLDQVLLRGWGDQVLTVTSIASAFASRLAYLLATLKRGDAVNRAARPEWDESYWAHWANIKTVILGGGLASGILGGVAAQLTEETILPSLDVHDLRIQPSTFGARLPLYGVARHAPKFLGCRTVQEQFRLGDDARPGMASRLKPVVVHAAPPRGRHIGVAARALPLGHAKDFLHMQSGFGCCPHLLLRKPGLTIARRWRAGAEFCRAPAPPCRSGVQVVQDL